MTGGERRRVDEAAARAQPPLRLQVDRQGYEVDKAGVAHQLRKLVAQVGLDVLAVEALEGPLPRLLKADEDREDLRRMDSGRSSTVPLSTGEPLAFPARFKALPKGVHGAIQVKYTYATDLDMRRYTMLA